MLPRTYTADKPSDARFTHGNNAGAQTQRSVGGCRGSALGRWSPSPRVTLPSGRKVGTALGAGQRLCAERYEPAPGKRRFGYWENLGRKNQ